MRASPPSSTRSPKPGRRRPTTPSRRSSRTWRWCRSATSAWRRLQAPWAPRRSCGTRWTSTTSPASWRGGPRGEGLGNRFLANIRETDAIVHVVRAHGDENVIHPEGRVDPLKDVETIETELALADLEQAERRVDRVARQARSGDRVAVAEEAWLNEVIETLRAGRPVRGVPVPEDALNAARDLGSLTAKPVLFVANVDEGSDVVPAEIAAHAQAQGAGAVAVSSRIEAELAELEDEDAAAMREELGVSESGLERVVREAFALLHLIAFFTAGEAKPAQSWHLRQGLTAWHAAGEIHSDIQKGFVRAEVIGWQELVG